MNRKAALVTWIPNCTFLPNAGLWVWSVEVSRSILCLWCEWVELREKFIQVSLTICSCVYSARITSAESSFQCLVGFLGEGIRWLNYHPLTMWSPDVAEGMNSSSPTLGQDAVSFAGPSVFSHSVAIILCCDWPDTMMMRPVFWELCSWRPRLPIYPPCFPQACHGAVNFVLRMGFRDKAVVVLGRSGKLRNFVASLPFSVSKLSSDLSGASPKNAWSWATCS